MPPDCPRPLRSRAVGEDAVQQRELLLLVVRRREGERLELALLEPLVRQVGLQPADRDLAQRALVEVAPRVNRRPSIISSSAVNDSGVAVVRRRGQEQPVLALLRELPGRDRPLAVDGVAAAPAAAVGLAGATWCASSTTRTSNANRRAVSVSAHVGVARRAAAAGRAATAATPCVTITRGNSRNGLAFRPVAAPYLRHQFAVDDHEVEAELLPHLVLPLQRQARRAHDDHGPGAVPQQQLLDDQAGLDGLAQADVVGEQQVRPRRTAARGSAAPAGTPRRSRRCGTAPGRSSASADVTAPQRTASTNAASVFGSSKPRG